MPSCCKCWLNQSRPNSITSFDVTRDNGVILLAIETILLINEYLTFCINLKWYHYIIIISTDIQLQCSMIKYIWDYNRITVFSVVWSDVVWRYILINGDSKRPRAVERTSHWRNKGRPTYRSRHLVKYWDPINPCSLNRKAFHLLKTVWSQLNTLSLKFNLHTNRWQWRILFR